MSLCVLRASNDNNYQSSHWIKYKWSQSKTNINSKWKTDSHTTTPPISISIGNRITNSQLLALSQELQQLEIVELQLHVKKKQNETN